MSDEHVHRAVPSLRKEEDLSERFPRTMPTHITDTCRCGATRRSKGLRAMANGQADREIRKALYDAIRANLALESLLRRKSLRIRSLIRRAVKNGVNVGSSPGGGQ